MSKLLILIVVLAAIAAGLYYGGVWPKQTTTSNAPAAGTPAPDDLYLKGDQYFASNQYQAAADTYREAVQRNPDSPRAAEARYRIGKTLEDAKKPAEALAAYKEYIEKNPNDESSRINQAKKRIDFITGTGAQ
ncbi:MAG: tetratricopeptide repeat protein [Phycisphaeraceae bacterium]|nr:tetratricopeptide repeat protein [Phycisphaeraceae bacterium]